MRILSIITARGGSKKLPNKNILKLKKKPLIAHTIFSSLKSNLIDKTIVSTDSSKNCTYIKEIWSKYTFFVPKN